MKTRAMALLAFILAFTLAAPALAQDDDFPAVRLPEGYNIEKVAGVLTYVTEQVA